MKYLYEGGIMKYLFTVIIIILLPLSVYGVEWTVKYEMIKPDSPLGLIKVTISIPKGYMEIPYLAGRWRCTINRSDHLDGTGKYKFVTSKVFLSCVLKEKQNVRISAEVGCDNGYIKDTKENRMQVGLFGTEEGDDVQIVTLECKL